MTGSGDPVRAPRTTRTILWSAVSVGLLLGLGGSGLFGQVEVPLILLGVLFVALALPGALARASCTARGITYVNGAVWRVPAEQVAEIQVERRGGIGAFPTVVVYRRTGRPVVLRAIADFDTVDGWRRQQALAARWRGRLRVPPERRSERRRRPRR